VKLKQLTIHNFLSVQNATLNLADKGLVSIEGENLDKTGSDSNGCGKSSIINAILWCCYGSYGKDESADDVVNSKAGKNCMVQTIWQDGILGWRITRYRKHSKHKNSIKVEMIDRAGWRDITKAGYKEVQVQINQILGADEMVFRASCFAEQENSLDIPGMTDKELKELLERCLPFEDFTEQYEKAQAQVRSQKTDIRELETQIQFKIWQISRSTEDLENAKSAYSLYKEKIKEDNEDLALRIKAKEDAIAVLKVITNTIKFLRERLIELQKELEGINTDDYGRLEWKVTQDKIRVSKLGDQIAEAEKGCYACGQALPDLDAIVIPLEIERTNLFEIIAIEEKQLEELYKLRHKKTELSAEIARTKGAFQEAKEASEQIGRLEAEIRVLRRSERVLEANPHSGTVERLSLMLIDAQQTKVDLEEKLKLEQERLEILEAVQQTYSPKGLRYHMLEKVAPVLTNATNEYLTMLTDGAIQAVWSTVSKTSTGEYREKFQIEALMEDRSKFGLLSGGEKRKVRLACFFALQDFIAARATKNIELWCGDEIDLALDQAGLERLMVLLEQKTKRKSTILVISHNELRDWIPNFATVTRKDGVTTITGYLNE
jgi:DNA repair exonuclease SbcCD ATPase subunit